MALFNQFSALFKTVENFKERLAKDTFLVSCISQIAVAFIMTLMAISNPDQVEIWGISAFFTITVNCLAVYFSIWHYQTTIKIYLIVVWLVNIVFMLISQGDNASHISMTVVLTLHALITALTLNTRWAVITSILSCFFLLLDTYFDQYFGFLTIKPVSKIELFFSIGCYSAAIIFISVFYHRAVINLLDEKQYEIYLRKRAQDNLQLSNDKLTELNSQFICLNLELEKHVAAVEDANKRLSRFAFEQSHHVRAPLARILGLCEVLETTISWEEKNRIVELVSQSARELDEVIHRMSRLLNELNVSEFKKTVDQNN